MRVALAEPQVLFTYWLDVSLPAVGKLNDNLPCIDRKNLFSKYRVITNVYQEELSGDSLPQDNN